MISSTSHSSSKTPRLTLALLVTGLIAWSAAAAYTLRINPDVRDFKAGAEIKTAWAEKLRSQFSSVNIVFGGSSSSFSVDPQCALEELKFPLANLALGAGMGAQVLTRFTAAEARPGDTLVMTMEPALLSGKLSIPQLGQQFSIAMRHPEFAEESIAVPVQSRVNPGMYLSSLRPGGSHFVTLMGKIIMRRPFYRYKIGDFRPSGQKTTDVRAPLSTPRGKVVISEEGRKLLAALKSWAETNQVKVVYTLPWAYCETNDLVGFREENLSFCEQMVEFFPVLQEGRLGAYEIPEHFADTTWHLNETGAKIRTRELVRALQKPALSDRDELKAFFQIAGSQPSAQ